MGKVKELFLENESSQKHCTSLITLWKGLSESDRKTVSDDWLNDLLVVSNCVRRENVTCKEKKKIEANFHLRALLVAKFDELPQYLKRNDSEIGKKITKNHKNLINGGGFYYRLFHIELKQHFGTQDKTGWTKGKGEWKLHAIHSWPM
jgi:hypothetical protein